MKNRALKSKKIGFLFALLSILSISCTSAQNWQTEEKTYRNGVLVLMAVDIELGEIINAEPSGKNVELIIDPFFNTFKIEWDEVDKEVRMILKPYRETSTNGTIYTDTYGPPDENLKFFIMNTIEKDGKFILVPINPTNIGDRAFKMIYAFENFH